MIVKTLVLNLIFINIYMVPNGSMGKKLKVNPQIMVCKPFGKH